MNTPVILDLTKRRYSDAIACDDIELVHRNPMNQVMQIWERLYNEVCNEENQNWYCCDNENKYKTAHNHNAISIFASRGAGKTTFLLSFLKKIQKKNEVVCLKTIDPSLMESKQRTIINVVASIHEIVDRFIRDEKADNPKGHKYGRYVELMKWYEKLLMALPFVDGVGHKGAYDDWDDSEYIAEQGMGKAIASNNLVETFHRYVDSLLALMEKKCLVISFDDIDTDFEKGFEMLEVIRRYLTSPKIIVILTGDLEQYSNLVRNFFWNHFSKEYLDKEILFSKRKKEEFSAMINQLESQYLVKILKPEYRIKLQTIGECLLYGADILICTSKTTNSAEVLDDIKDFYKNNLVAKLIPNFSFNNVVSDNIVNFLTRLSIRIQMRILALLYELKLENLELGEYISRLSEGLLKIFNNDINQKTDNAKELMEGNNRYVEQMLTFLVNTGCLHTRKNFLPESSDEVLNKALFAIGSEFNNLLKQNKTLIFEYWIRISYVQILMEKIQGGWVDETAAEFLRFSQMNTETGLSKCLGLSHAFCNSKLNQSMEQEQLVRTLPGTILVGHKSPLLQSGIRNKTVLLSMLGTVDSNNREFVFLSVYKLLNVAREFLILFGKSSSRKRQNLREEFVALLNKHSQYRVFLEPQKNVPVRWENSESGEFDDWLYKLNDDEYDTWVKLRNMFDGWAQIPLKNVSLQLLDKIFTRFYFSLMHIEKYQRSTNPGHQLSLCLTALLNAALVENAIECGISPQNWSNYGDIEYIFIENVEHLKENSEKDSNHLHFFQWLSQCPLFGMFMNPLVYQLLNATTTGKDQSLLAAFTYGRLLLNLNTLKSQVETLKTEITEIKEGLEWVNRFYKLTNLKSDLVLLQKILENATEKNEFNQFNILLKEKRTIEEQIQRLENGLQPLKKEIFPCELKRGMNENLISEANKNLYDLFVSKDNEYKKATERLVSIQKRISTQNKNDSLVKRIYFEVEEQRSSSHILSVYNDLCDITSQLK